VTTAPLPPLGWLGILRLGLVQTALGAIVVLTTAALNRVMVVEHQLPATLPGLLVALHYALQMLRPRMGHGSDQGGRRTPWIIGGMAVLGTGGVLAAIATAWMGTIAPGIALAAFAFTLIGLGVGAAGTSLLVLLAKRVAPDRRAPAATIVWMMMILGFALTATIAGKLLDPFSFERMVWVTTGVSVVAVAVTLLAVIGVEGHAARRPAPAGPAPKTAFTVALREAWADPQARRFTIFVFVSMLAYSAQDLIRAFPARAGHTPVGTD
jgi:BCD family chlorophyll transporter-like MFS transporter